jgi:glycosyltransferase involved in cell wall biosynthesis
MPQVSIVIPVFNSARLIGTALQSVFAQRLQDFEVIVVDDGSEDRDELLQTLGEWRDRVQYIRQPNRGPASARNTGIRHASGGLIAFLDADDEWRPRKLERQAEYFERYPETGLLHTAVVGQKAGGALAGPPRQVFCDLFHTVFSVNTLTVMIPRRVLDCVGGFDERREIHTEDWDLWLRIAAKYPFGYLDEPLAVYRPGGGMSRQIDRTYEAQALVVEKSRALCAKACARHREDPGDCERRRLYVLNRDWGYDRLMAGDRSGARACLGRALACSPLQPRTAALYLSTFLPAVRHGDRKRQVHAPAAAPATPDRSPTGPDRPVTACPPLVHDTAYRRLRRRALSKLHDADDALWRGRHARRRVLFDAASPMSFAIFRPVYDRLRPDPRLDFWFTAHGRVWQPEEIFRLAGVSGRVVPASTAAWMKVDLYINADFWDMTWLHRRTRRIHMFHGVAGKYSLDAPFDLAPTIAAFDSLMFANVDRRQRYVDAALVPDDNVKAALVGYPKVDCLVDGTLGRMAVMRELELDPSIPTVLYAPTWSPHSSLNHLGEEIIERIAADGLQLIVKLHDRSYDRRERGAGCVDWASRLSKYDEHPRVRIVRGADSSPYLVASDLLISDHSSVAFEFMLLDRPIVVIDRPDLVRQAAINPDKVRLLRSAAIVAADGHTLERGVRDELQRPRPLGEIRRRTAAHLFYGAGTATDRAVALIYRVMRLPVYEDSRGRTEEETALRAVS